MKESSRDNCFCWLSNLVHPSGSREFSVVAKFRFWRTNSQRAFQPFSSKPLFWDWLAARNVLFLGLISRVFSRLQKFRFSRHCHTAITDEQASVFDFWGSQKEKVLYLLLKCPLPTSLLERFRSNFARQYCQKLINKRACNSSFFFFSKIAA